MKNLIVFVVLAMLLVLFKAQAQTRTVWRTIYCTNSSISVPVNFTSGLIAAGATNLYASRLTIIGKKFARGTNAAVVFVGPIATNELQPYPINPGEVVTLTSPDGTPFNLRDWYLDVTTVDDGLTIIFQ